MLSGSEFETAGANRSDNVSVDVRSIGPPIGGPLPTERAALCQTRNWNRSRRPVYTPEPAGADAEHSSGYAGTGFESCCNRRGNHLSHAGIVIRIVEDAPLSGRRRLFASLLLLVVAMPLPKQVLAEALRIGGTGSLVPVFESLAEAYRGLQHRVAITVLPTLGSTGGINALRAGAVDLALSARPLSGDESNAGLRAHQLARTAMVFVTSRRLANPTLDQSQIVGLFSGTVRHWPDGSPVRLILRPPGDSDTAILVERYPLLGPGLEASRRHRGIPVAGTDQETVDLAASRDGTFTTSTLIMVRDRAPSLTVFRVDGIQPDLDTIADGSYPLLRDYWVVTGEEPGSAISGFLDFLRSDDASRILRDHGALPLAAGGL